MTAADMADWLRAKARSEEHLGQLTSAIQLRRIADELERLQAEVSAFRAGSA